MARRVTAADVMGDPQLQADVARISYEADLRVARIYVRRGEQLPQALWRRLRRYRRAHRG